MADTHETIADIVAAKRRLAAEMEKALGDQHASVEMLKDDADRIEAAHKREIEATAAKCCQLGRLAGYGASEIKHQQEPVGDATKLREACANIAEYARSAQCHTEDAHVLGYLNQIEGWAKAALAAPPRNCDKYATADEALKAQEQMFNDSNFANGECKLGCPECDNPRVGCKIAWLFAPATEKEGGANSESPCNHCADYLGWITIEGPDGVWVDRPWCYRHDEVCQPYKHGCIKEGGAK